MPGIQVQEREEIVHANYDTDQVLTPKSKKKKEQELAIHSPKMS
jgi:hypothetical protein